MTSNQYEKSRNRSARLLAVLCLFTPLMIGGIPAWSQTLTLLITCGVLWSLLRSQRLKLSSSTSIWLLGAWLSMCGAIFSLIPFSLESLELLSTSSYQGWRDLDKVNPHQVWSSLSLSPVHTFYWISQQFTWILIAYIASHLHKHRRFVLYTLVMIGPLLTLIGLTHWWLGSDRIYGIYQSYDRVKLTGFFTSFINPNHSASVMILSGLTAFGLGTQLKNHRRLLWSLTLLSGVGIILCQSRMGILCGGAGLMILIWRLHPKFKRWGGLLFSLMILGGLIRYYQDLSVLFYDLWSTEKIYGVFNSQINPSISLSTYWNNPTPYPRFHTWLNLGTYLQDYMWFGSGRGSFGEVFTTYQDFITRGWVSHPENHILQQWTEGGVIGVIGGVLLPFVAWLHWWRRARGEAHATALALWVAVAMVCVHQLFDFGLESLGLGVPMAISWGLLWSYLSVKEVDLLDREAERRRQINRKRTAQALVLIGILFSVGCILLHKDRLRPMVDQLIKNPSLTAGQEALKWHPKSVHITFNTATILPMTSPKLSKWIQLTQRLMPAHGGVYQLEGRLLQSQGFLRMAYGSYYKALLNEPWERHRVYKDLLTFSEIDLKQLPKQYHSDFMQVFVRHHSELEALSVLERLSLKDVIDDKILRRLMLRWAYHQRRIETIWQWIAVLTAYKEEVRDEVRDEVKEELQLDLIFAQALSFVCQGRLTEAQAHMRQFKEDFVSLSTSSTQLHQKRSMELQKLSAPSNK